MTKFRKNTKVDLTEKIVCACCGKEKTEQNTPAKAVWCAKFWCVNCLPKLEVCKTW